MQNSTCVARQFGAVQVLSPPPLQLHARETSLHLLEKPTFDPSLASSPALSSSQGESRLISSADSVPADSPQLPYEQEQSQASPEIIGNFNDGDADADFESHEDSFYASLMAAQQLRRQRGNTATSCNSPHGTTPARTTITTITTSATATTTTATTEKAAASAEVRSHASSVSLRGSPCDKPLSHPPRTLQELLAWRQGLIDARMKAQQEQEVRMGESLASVIFSLSVSGGSGSSPGGETSRKDHAPALLSPRTESPPQLFSSHHPPKIQFLAPAISTTSAPPQQPLTNAPTCHHRRLRPAGLNALAMKTCTMTGPRITRTPVPTQGWLPHELPLPCATHPHSSAASTSVGSSALTSRTGSRWIDSQRDPAEMEEIVAYFRQHDTDMRDSLLARLFFLAVVAVVVVFFFRDDFTRLAFR